MKTKMNSSVYSNLWKEKFGDLDGRWSKQDDEFLIKLLLDEWVKGNWIAGGKNNRQAIQNAYVILCAVHGVTYQIQFIWRKIEEFRSRYFLFKYLLIHPETLFDENTRKIKCRSNKDWNDIVEEVPLAVVYKNNTEPFYDDLGFLFHTGATH